MAWDNDAAADEVIRREAARLGLTETQYRMIKAAGTDVVQSIVWDHIGRHDVNKPASMTAKPNAGSGPVERGTGWAKEIPLRPPEGVALIDQMVEAQTAKERLHAAVEAIEANEAIKRAREQKD
jgi:hypothetical protein